MTRQADMHWQFHTFPTLDTSTLFAVMKLRVDVFVVEQACAYPELDSHDTHSRTLHLLGHENDQLVAYARAMPSDQSLDGQRQVQIGRVVVASSHRRQGIARMLMQQMLARLEQDHADYDVVLSSQVGVKQFYESMGFISESAVYLEDGIEHIDMRRTRLAAF